MEFFIFVMKYYTSVKMKEVNKHVEIWLKFENMM